MHTETNTPHAGEGPTWLWKQWHNVDAMRKDGVPVVGFTWYGLLDHVDWDSLMTQVRGHIDRCGLYDLNRKPHPVARAYRELISAHRSDPLVEHSPFFGIE
jgi:beta-glucosidase/6-phospho-beta-glucosidase/beta-galactosidase